MNFKPLGNRVLLQRDEAQDEKVLSSGLVLLTTDRPQTATVVAVGDGQVTETGAVLPMHVTVGSRVVLGKYSGYDLNLDGGVYTILAETDILGVLNA